MLTLAEIGPGYGLGVSSHQKATPWFEGRAFVGEGREKSQRPPLQPPWVSAHGKLLLGVLYEPAGEGQRAPRGAVDMDPGN